MIDLPLTIEETQKGLLNKKFSAVELVDSYLSRINKFNDDLNIFLTVTDDVAYNQAKEVDRIINSSKNPVEQFPLLGVGVSHKDIFLTKRVRTTAGSKVLTNYVPTYSATSVRKIEDSGAILLGKVNCDAWAHGSSGENSDFKPTKNPWGKKFVAGGSSSGSAAALSANMALISTGTDTCGSIRVPANFNYLVSLKPTYGAVSRYGVIAMASSLDTVGPMGRSVSDVKKVFEVIRGQDGLDSTVTAISLDRKKAKLAIGVPKEFFVEGLDSEVRSNIEKAVAVFKKLGFEIREVSLPSTKYAIDVYYIIQPVEVASNLGRFDGVRYGGSRQDFGDEAKRRIMLGTYVSSAGYYDDYYLTAMKVRNKIKIEVDNVFEQVDALIAPVAPTGPFKLGEKTNDPVKMYLTDIFAATANLCGIPSLAIPFNFSNLGMPLGFQLMGSRFSEEVLFEIGEKFHKEVGYKPMVAKI